MPNTEVNAPAVDLLGTVIDPAAPVIGLKAYWVGELDIYAAVDADAALALHQAIASDPDDYTLDDVCPVGPETLAKPMVDEDGTPCPSLAEELAAATQPGWLAGFE